ncbi:hypothetical protein GEMRC1_003330 [Eukaryota sp. GEM-RC1]
MTSCDFFYQSRQQECFDDVSSVAKDVARTNRDISKVKKEERGVQEEIEKGILEEGRCWGDLIEKFLNLNDFSILCLKEMDSVIRKFDDLDSEIFEILGILIQFYLQLPEVQEMNTLVWKKEFKALKSSLKSVKKLIIDQDSSLTAFLTNIFNDDLAGKILNISSTIESSSKFHDNVITWSSLFTNLLNCFSDLTTSQKRLEKLKADQSNLIEKMTSLESSLASLKTQSVELSVNYQESVLKYEDWCLEAEKPAQNLKYFDTLLNFLNKYSDSSKLIFPEPLSEEVLSPDILNFVSVFVATFVIYGSLVEPDLRVELGQFLFEEIVLKKIKQLDHSSKSVTLKLLNFFEIGLDSDLFELVFSFISFILNEDCMFLSQCFVKLVEKFEIFHDYEVTVNIFDPFFSNEDFDTALKISTSSTPF